MKSRKLFVLLMLHIAVIAALVNLAAAEKEVFSGKVYTNQEKTIDSYNWTFLYDLQSQKVLVDLPASSIIISRGNCDTRDAYRICIDRANFSSRNYTTYVDTYELGIRVFKITPEISVNRTLSPGTLLQGEQGLVKVIIDNPSNFEVSDLDYREDFSKFKIKELQGCENINGIIQWKGSLKLKYSKECSFKIRAYGEISIQSKANLTYNDGFSVITAQSPLLSIEVKGKQLKAVAGKSSWIEPKIPFQYNLTLENLNEKEEISAHLSSLFPSYVKIKKKPEDFWVSGSELLGNVKLKAKEKKPFTFTLEADSGGSEPVRHKLDYTIKTLDDKIELQDLMEILSLKPEISLIISNNSPNPNEKIIFIADLKNPSRHHDFTALKAELASEFIEPVANELKALKSNQSYRILSNTLIAPNDIDKKQYLLNFKLLYSFNGKISETVKNISFGRVKAETGLKLNYSEVSLTNETPVMKTNASANESATLSQTIYDANKTILNATPKSEAQNQSSVSEEIQAVDKKSQGKTGAEPIEIKETPEDITGIMESTGISGKHIAIILTAVLFGVLITLKFMFKSKE